MSRENEAPRQPPPPPTRGQQGRYLPHNNDAEEWVIAACLWDGRIVPAVMDVLPVKAMYTEGHKVLLQAMYDLVSRGDHVDVVSLVDSLERSGNLSIALPKGEAQLMDLVDRTLSTAGIKTHAKIVLEYWITRETIALTRRLHEESWKVALDFPKSLALMRTLALDLVDKAKLIDRLIASEVLR